MTDDQYLGQYIVTDPDEQRRWIDLARRYDEARPSVWCGEGDPPPPWHENVSAYLAEHPDARVSIRFLDLTESVSWSLWVGEDHGINFGQSMWEANPT